MQRDDLNKNDKKDLFFTLKKKRKEKTLFYTVMCSVSSVVKTMDRLSEGSEFKSYHYQAATVGHLVKAFNPQLFHCIK